MIIIITLLEGNTIFPVDYSLWDYSKVEKCLGYMDSKGPLNRNCMSTFTSMFGVKVLGY